MLMVKKALRAERRDEGGGIGRLHEGFADENGVGAGSVDAGGIGGGVNTALADRDHGFRKLRDEAFTEAEVGLEDGEVAVVDADDFRVVGEGPGELGGGVNFEKGVEPGGIGGGFDATS